MIRIFKDRRTYVALTAELESILNLQLRAINPQFESAGDFSDSLALVAIGKRFRYVDKAGKFVINPQFDDAGNFNAGLAPVWLGGREGYINKDGRYVWNPTS